MFLSIIIPCYNSSKTIKRLLDSIVEGKLNKDDYEVIISDDNSTDDFMDIVNKYDNVMNIIYHHTDEVVHCPGNTRQEAIKLASGDWICFIDHDDMFVPEALLQVKNMIKTRNFQYCFITNVYTYDDVNNTIINIEDGYYQNYSLLHGKFFNRENLINKYNIHFMKDLETDEDLYFNNQVYSIMIGADLPFEYFPMVTYKWVQNPESLSHKDFTSQVDRSDKFLQNFLLANIELFLDFEKQYPDKKERYEGYIFNNITFIYYYSLFLPFRLSDNQELLERNIGYIKNTIKRVFEGLSINTDYFEQKILPSINIDTIKTQFHWGAIDPDQLMDYSSWIKFMLTDFN